MTDDDAGNQPDGAAFTPSPASPILVEKGADPSVLVIAFTGFKGGLMLPAFDFLSISGLLDYSRILLLDTTKTLYLGGVPPLAPDYFALLGQLREHVAALAPRTILSIGASSGGFAALLIGHALGADYVHAFSPYTYVNRATIDKNDDQNGLETRMEDLERIWALPASVHGLFDLEPLLRQDNGKTRFYVHVCGESRWDLMRALHLRHCPRIRVIAYTCNHHAVTVSLARNRLLTDLLRVENQERIEEVVRERLVVRTVDTRSLPPA